ncbi:uncharacterized protein LOC133178816 [Saccostrea echinata]|uniref:uncharacterized protein LOC133178816 n=1 Tax=Saccostrea echinata TaxID=191078 RepID=UPI002A82EE0F|nr:uncharacterized protein LOC133178816 [Saccostrea echinata]
MSTEKRGQTPHTFKRTFLKAVLIFYFMRFCLSYDEEFCEESRSTVKKVPSCPVNKTMWDAEALKKNCSSVSHNCSHNLLYHCLINPWQNSTIEVCAPRTVIGYGYCAEYNYEGGRVQDSFDAKPCLSCYNDYWSTDAYKYAECYVVNRPHTDAAVRYTTLSNVKVISGAAQEASCPGIWVGFYLFLNQKIVQALLWNQY